MFSPDLMRYIIDPDNSIEKAAENKNASVEKKVFRFSLLNQQKLLNDCSLLSKILTGVDRAFESFASHS